MKKVEFVRLGIKFKDIHFESDSRSLTNEYVNLKFSENFSLEVKPLIPIYIKEVYFDLKFDTQDKIKMFRNGFQSWAPSYEVDFDTRFEKCLFPVLNNHYLDPENFNEGKSHFFAYVRFDSDRLFFIPENNSLKVSFELVKKDTLRLCFELAREVSKELTTPGIKITDEIGKRDTPKEKIFGWTSWYYYYRNINPDKLIENLSQIDKLPIKLNYFQIDDGWQKSISEWEENDRFKGKLKEIAEIALDKGTTPGIWLAPFIAERKSQIFERRKEWLIKNKDGSFRPVGFNPLWSGYFYALDPTNEEVLDYLTEQILKIRKLGFRMFKFDFLYSLMATFEVLRDNYSRMDIFRKAMGVLREAIGEDSVLLGCGAPVLLKNNLYDYLRIGPDTKDGWEDTVTRLLRFQGRNSAKNSLRNTLTRAFINGLYFLNDPDVIFLRPKHLTNDEKEAIIITNYFLSDFIFFSDPLSQLANSDFDLLLKLKAFDEFVLKDVEELKKDIFEFSGTVRNDVITGIVNLTERIYTLPTSYGELIFGHESKNIKPHSASVYSSRVKS